MRCRMIQNPAIHSDWIFNMTDLFTGYPNDGRHIPQYISYQEKYRLSPRESDRVLIELATRDADKPLRVLDIGCSTGNLLRHLRDVAPHFHLIGGEMSDAQLEACRQDKTLAGISFEKLDILNLPKNSFDIIIANAILYGFDDGKFAQALNSIAEALTVGGSFYAFDFFHDFPQEIAIVEKTAGFPDGHPLHFRSRQVVEQVVHTVGLTAPVFQPFNISLDLPAKPDALIQTRTVKTDTGDRLQFRGALYQPWCHLSAKKAS